MGLKETYFHKLQKRLSENATSLVLYLDSSETKRVGILYEIVPIIFICLSDFSSIIDLLLNKQSLPPNLGVRLLTLFQPGGRLCPLITACPSGFENLSTPQLLMHKNKNASSERISFNYGWMVSYICCVLAHLSYWESVDKETDLRSSELLN